MKKILILLVVLLMLPFVAAQTPPGITFHQFFGNIDNPAQGFNIVAIVNNVSFTTTVDSNNQYGYNPLFLVDTGANGDNVIFTVNGYASVTASFQQGGVTALDLTYSGPAPVSPPSPPSGGGGGGRGRGWYDTVEEEIPIEAGGPVCYDDWICTSWSPCRPNGIQVRECYFNDYEECIVQLQKPATEQTCEPGANCYDGLQNQGEEGVDCGGPCSPCPTCFDGIQNQGEEGVDCGGPCRSCIFEIIQMPTNWWMLALFFLIILGVFIGVYYLYSTKRPKKTASLKSYIKTAKRHKVPKQEIKKVLQKQGWKPSEIKKHL